MTLNSMRTAEHSARELGSRSARQRLPIQPRPYFTHVQDGLSLGYRRGKRGGSWIARSYDQEHGYRFGALGKANDLLEDVGLSFQAAQAACRTWFSDQSRADLAGTHQGPYTVADAAHDWLAAWTGSERGKATSTANVQHHILPLLGTIPIRKLSAEQIERWLRDLASKEPVKVQQRKASAKKLSPSRQSKVVYDPKDPETQRKRRDSANRVFTDLRSLLNRAYKRQKVESRAAWDVVPRLENATKTKNDYLTADEARRFVAACPTEFRNLVYAALSTGCRYNELCSLHVEAFDSRDNTVFVLQSKTGNPKRIHLTEEEANFFAELTAERTPDAPMFLRWDGLPWQKSHQQHRMKLALKEAGITRKIRFHDLRHTLASLLIQQGVAIEVIANQLGHSSPVVTAKHYAHLSPEYIGRSVRANKPSFAMSPKN